MGVVLELWPAAVLVVSALSAGVAGGVVAAAALDLRDLRRCIRSDTAADTLGG